MTEQQAFGAWWFDPTTDKRYLSQHQFSEYVWQAACAWQREQDAKLCEGVGEKHYKERSAYECAAAIRAALKGEKT